MVIVNSRLLVTRGYFSFLQGWENFREVVDWFGLAGNAHTKSHFAKNFLRRLLDDFDVFSN